jgi:hypothetical protein
MVTSPLRVIKQTTKISPKLKAGILLSQPLLFAIQDRLLTKPTLPERNFAEKVDFSLPLRLSHIRLSVVAMGAAELTQLSAFFDGLLRSTLESNN